MATLVSRQLGSARVPTNISRLFLLSIPLAPFTPPSFPSISNNTGTTLVPHHKGTLPPVQILSLVDTPNRQRGFHHDGLYASVPRFPINNWDHTVHWVLSVNVQVIVPTSLKSELVEIVQAQALGSSPRLLSGFHPISSVHHNAPEPPISRTSTQRACWTRRET